MTITLSEARHRALKEASVLARPGLRKLHGLTAAEVDTVLTDLARHAIVPRPVPAPPAPDRGDQRPRELPAVRSDIALVTGDNLLLADAGMRGRVIPAVEFMVSFASRAPRS